MSSIFSLLLTVATKITHPVVFLGSSIAASAGDILLLLGSCVLLFFSWIRLLLKWFGNQFKAGKKQYSENLQLQRNIYWYVLIYQ